MLLVIIYGRQSASYTQEPETHNALEVEYDSIKMYALSAVRAEFGADQWIYFGDLVNRESGWKPDAQNPTSSAMGLGQFLDSTWERVDCIKSFDPYYQIDCMVGYVALFYENPQRAIVHHNQMNWY